MTWWEQHADLTDGQIALLRDTPVRIADLGKDVIDDGDGTGWLLGRFGSDGVITIDDDAADHGWSLGLGGVAHNKVDLFSVLVHEMGHVLGWSDEDMDNTLAVGERILPEVSVTPPDGDHGDDDQHDSPDDDHGDHGQPPIEHLLTLVGAAAAEQQMHLQFS